jgi:4-hydroxy-3-polyprenylbenzoate decarboxylase/2,5-furandicarboxylate decarboxylase 1
MLKDLRSFLRLIEQQGDLVHITQSVDPEWGVAAGLRKSSDIQGPALWFDDVVGSSMPVVGGLYAARRRAMWGLEADSNLELHRRFIHGLKNPIPPRIVGDGPCKEVILRGDDADLGRLPICTHNRLDPGPYITMGIQVARHPDYGTNVSISRMQVFDGKTTGIMSVPPQQLGVYHLEAEAQGKSLEVAVCIGNDPYTTFCSQVAGSIYLDEFTVAGGWLGEPLELVKCETIDVYVPATTEIVLEGELLCGERRLEGPFGEYPGYYSPATDRQVFKLKAITHRRDPIYLAGLTGLPTTDNHVMKQVIFEAMLYERLRQICPTLRDVCVTDAGAGGHVVVSLRPTYASQARDVMLAAFTTERIRPKLVTVVDEDIDPRDPQQVEWAMAFRFQADQDVVILPRMNGQTLDPSTPAVRVGAMMGIDATQPYGVSYGEVCTVPGADEFVIPGWTDVEARRGAVGAPIFAGR